MAIGVERVIKAKQMRGLFPWSHEVRIAKMRRIDI
jgi:hypothetical protein